MGRQGLGCGWVDSYRCQDSFPGLVGPFGATGGRFGAIFHFSGYPGFPGLFFLFSYYSPVWLAYYSPVWLAYYSPVWLDRTPTTWRRARPPWRGFLTPGAVNWAREGSAHKRKMGP